MTTSQTYDFHIHSHVLLRGDEYPRPILWCDGVTVVSSASYSDRLLDVLDHERVTKFDAQGDMLVRVPVALVRSFLTDDEAEAVVKCVDADERLLSYAR